MVSPLLNPRKWWNRQEQQKRKIVRRWTPYDPEAEVVICACGSDLAHIKIYDETPGYYSIYIRCPRCEPMV